MQFEELDELGYIGFSLAFNENKMELVTTSSVAHSFNPKLVEYLHAVIVSGNLKFSLVHFNH